MRIIVFSETTDRTATPGASTSPRAATAASAKTSETTTATHNNRATSSSVYAVDGTIFFSLYTRNSYSGIHLRPDLPRNESLPGSPAAPYTQRFSFHNGDMPSDDTLSMRKRRETDHPDNPHHEYPHKIIIGRGRRTVASHACPFIVAGH